MWLCHRRGSWVTPKGQGVTPKGDVVTLESWSLEGDGCFAIVDDAATDSISQNPPSA